MPCLLLCVGQLREAALLQLLLTFVKNSRVPSLVSVCTLHCCHRNGVPDCYGTGRGLADGGGNFNVGHLSPAHQPDRRSPDGQALGVGASNLALAVWPLSHRHEFGR